MASQSAHSKDKQQLHDLVEELADQLCPAVDGEFDFAVKVSTHDESIDKLQMLVNLVLDSASRALAELRETKDYAENIIQSMIDMLVVVAPGGNIVTANAAICNLLGYQEEELIGQPVRMLFCEEENIPHSLRVQNATPPQTDVRSSLAEQASGGNAETWLRAKSGQEICVHLSHAIMRDSNGQLRGIVCIARDITESKRLQMDRERFNRVIQQSLNEIFIFDAETLRFVDVNYGAQKNLGYSMAELREMTPLSFKPEFTAESFADLVRPLRDGIQEKIQFDTVHQRKNGSRYPVEVHLQLMDSESPVFVAIILDTTERKASEARLIEAKAVADSANLAKSEFLANMSHEIRTPMTAILGFAENLQDSRLSESERLNCVHTIRRNGEALLGIINDILDLSKIEAGKMGTERVSCDPCSVIAEVASLLRVQAEAKGLPLNIEYIGAIPKTIHTDEVRLRQILINLIGNAIKFTDTGSVRLVTRFVDGGNEPKPNHPPTRTFYDLVFGDEGDEASLQFDVIDTGQGMTEGQIAKLFQPFTQTDASTTRRFGGTGLGLTISKRFAELLGGDITVVTTEIGVGTIFRATVATGSLNGVTMLEDPLSATVVDDAHTTVAQVAPSDLHGLRILLAEDGPDNQRLISFVLKKAGADVTVEENGKLALDAALAARDEGKPFDCILMDIQMPVMDGYEATGQLRQRGYWGPIIALTAHAMAGDREKCIRAGCDDYATKPIDRGKLIALIVTQVSKRDVGVPLNENGSDALVSELTDGDLVETVETFAAELPERIAAIEAAIDGQNLATLAALTRQLKWSAGGHGFANIKDAAGLIEFSAKTGQEPDTLTQQTRALAELCHRARAIAATT